MNNLTFGVEIEYRDLSRVKVTKFIQEYFPDWKSEKEDAIIKSSINPKLGGEIISPILKDNEKTWHDITIICKYLVDNQASSLNTGAHIHIGSGIFQNDPQIFFRFIKLWCAYEHIIYRFSHGEYCYARDSLFTYAPPVSKELKFLMRTLKLTESSSFSYLITVLNREKKRIKFK